MNIRESLGLFLETSKCAIRNESEWIGMREIRDTGNNSQFLFVYNIRTSRFFNVEQQPNLKFVTINKFYLNVTTKLPFWHVVKQYCLQQQVNFEK